MGNPKSELADRCRYKEGHIYQQVFSCNTCYMEQISQLSPELQEKAKNAQSNAELAEYVKPHGFCLGCLVYCHEGHDTNELYGKLDFRCDCGNSAMPFSCKLDNEKDYDNPKNYYNQTFFDSYCYCKKAHSMEDPRIFMIECHECEDWFHSNCLLPPLEEEVDTKFLLICRKCIETKFKSTIYHY